MSATDPCATCGFELWNPITPTPRLAVSDLALYDDSRFPGRCILRLGEHSESLTDLAAKEASAFMLDVREAMQAIQLVTGAERVNVAVLGNTVSHVHAHLIPRFPANEEKPEKSPWDDPRPKTALPAALRFELIMALEEALS